MEKRNYTHVQKLLPEVQRMVAEGKSQREIAEELGLKNKYVVKRLKSVPLVGGWTPAKIEVKVDLPLPFSPINPQTSPRFNSKST